MSLKRITKTSLRYLPPVKKCLTVLHWKIKNAAGSYEEAESCLLSSFVKSGDLVLDIGCNMGQYASLLSRLIGEDGKVMAFEAIRDTYELAKRILSGHKNVELKNIAISDHFGTVTMTLYGDNAAGVKSGWSSVAQTAIHGKGDSLVSVSCETLDALLSSRDRRVSFIKCDVEGHELQVFKGAMNLLRSDRPVILCEVEPDRFDALVSYLAQFDYRAMMAEGKETVLVLEPIGLNYFFLPGNSQADTNSNKNA